MIGNMAHNGNNNPINVKYIQSIFNAITSVGAISIGNYNQQVIRARSGVALKAKIKNISFNAFVVSACFLFAAFTSLVLSVIYLRPLKDSQILSIFNKHRLAFEELRQLVTKDSNHESYFSASDLDSEISNDRRKQYKILISEIHRGLTVNVDYDGTVRFIISSGGVLAVGPGWYEGVEYIPREYQIKGNLMQNLDEKNKIPAGVYLKQVEPHWFLFYQKDE